MAAVDYGRNWNGSSGVNVVVKNTFLERDANAAAGSNVEISIFIKPEDLTTNGDYANENQ